MKGQPVSADDYDCLYRQDAFRYLLARKGEVGRAQLLDIRKRALYGPGDLGQALRIGQWRPYHPDEEELARLLDGVTEV